MYYPNKLWVDHASKIAEKIQQINLKELSDGQLRQKTAEFKEKVAKGISLDAILPEAFAVAAEASTRVLGLTPYKVQLIGGIALHHGKIAEQKTGEGKSLTAVAPCYLNALTGKGVHVVTVNDYLAKRDAENIGRVYEFLGLSVGCVLSGSNVSEKKTAYGCDITYVTNSELGFDYLRDNMALNESYIVLRGLEYAIIDEVDSILIDEARTPLIISGNPNDVSALYMACNIMAQRMQKGKADKEFNKMDAFIGEEVEETGDFIVHEKDKLITLTKDGIKKIEEFFMMDCYADSKNIRIQHTMEQALKANYIMERDKDYIVKDGQVLIVDTFTGRVMEGRQFSDGLHQAIQAKENVMIDEEAQTIATTTYQNFFRKYKKISGMTGTAYSEKREFKRTYNLDTVVIPTNKPVIRKDRPDVVYLTKKAKYNGVLKEIEETHKTGQPILVGTASVESSEEVSAILRKAGIAHRVLNAKQDKDEADIVAQAGKFGMVTIATNMAGRGTDILLDEKAKAAGGLKVIGTERHESRRIDDQLRGRSGRQGDPGESVFYLSMEDDMVRLFAPDRAKSILKAGGFDENEPISEKILTSAIRKAQRKVEDNHFGTRKNVLEYDIINDSQRERIYQERRKLLAGESAEEEFKYCMKMAVNQIADMLWSKENPEDTEEAFQSLFGCKVALNSGMSKKDAEQKMFRMALSQHQRYAIDEETKRKHERMVILKSIDACWTEQLQALDFLRTDIYYYGYAQKDPKSVYAIEAYKLYDKMKDIMYSSAVYMFFHTIPTAEISKQVVSA